MVTFAFGVIIVQLVAVICIFDRPISSNNLLMKNSILIIFTLFLGLTPAFAQTGTTHDETVEISEKVLALLADKKFETVNNMFEDKVKEQITTERLGQIWNGLIERLGEFKKSEGITVKEEKGYQTTLNKCQFEKSTIGLKLAFNDANQISGFFLVPAK